MKKIAIMFLFLCNGVQAEETTKEITSIERLQYKMNYEYEYNSPIEFCFYVNSIGVILVGEKRGYTESQIFQLLAFSSQSVLSQCVKEIKENPNAYKKAQ